MLPLQRLIAATPPNIKRRARDQCYGQSYAPSRKKAARVNKVTKSGGYVVEDETGTYREFKYRVKCTDGWRKTAVRFYGPMNTNTKVWCWCSCPYFMYHAEVALARHGSSSVVQSNGQRPRFTNPRLEPRVCKHVFLLFALAMRKRQPGDKLSGTVNQPKGRSQTKQTKREVWAGDQLRGPKTPRRTAIQED